MKAALWYGRKDVRVEEIEESKVTSGYVKIKVKWCGICGSDLHSENIPITFPSDNLKQ